jgi:uncharacterized membrane protein
MSSDGKPLWGFRKIFFLIGLLFGVSAIWTVVDLLHPNERFAALNPPGSPNHTILVVTVPISALLCAANLWYWMQLRHGRYTPRNWVIGLLLLLPTMLILPFGILCIVNWCAKTCKSLFYTPDKKPPPLQQRQATGVPSAHDP